MMSLPKSCVEFAARIRFERRHERVHVEDVDPERGEHLIAGRQVPGLLEEAGQASVGIHLQDTETLRFFGRHFDRRERRPGTVLAVELEHLRVVHLVDVIAGQHDELTGILPQDGVEVLVDGVRRAEIPCSPTRSAG